jgi:hypothetical protein
MAPLLSLQPNGWSYPSVHDIYGLLALLGQQLLLLVPRYSSFNMYTFIFFRMTCDYTCAETPILYCNPQALSVDSA